MQEHEFTFDIEVPIEYLDEDGVLRPEFFEPLFNMLGNELGDTGAKVERINIKT